MFCLNCNQELPDNAQFCISCGISTQEESTQEPKKTRKQKLSNMPLVFYILGFLNAAGSLVLGITTLPSFSAFFVYLAWGFIGTFLFFAIGKIIDNTEIIAAQNIQIIDYLGKVSNPK